MCMTLDEIKHGLRRDSERFTRTGIRRPASTTEEESTTPTNPRRVCTPDHEIQRRTVYCRFNIFNLHDVDVKDSTVKGKAHLSLSRVCEPPPRSTRLYPPDPPLLWPRDALVTSRRRARTYTTQRICTMNWRGNCRWKTK